MNELRLRTDDLSWRELDGEVVALDGEQFVYLGTNEAGALLWQKLSSGATRDQLVEELQASFDIDVDQAGQDVDSFIAELRANNLLED